MHINDYLDCDFYSVEMIGEDKVVHVHGYFYGMDDWYKSVEYCWFIVPLSKFIGNDFNYELFVENIKQYIYDLDDGEIEKAINEYYNGNPATKLPYYRLTMDTPVGNYVDME